MLHRSIETAGGKRTSDLDECLLSPIPDVQTGEICPILRSAFGHKRTLAFVRACEARSPHCSSKVGTCLCAENYIEAQAAAISAAMHLVITLKQIKALAVGRNPSAVTKIGLGIATVDGPA